MATAVEARSNTKFSPGETPEHTQPKNLPAFNEALRMASSFFTPNYPTITEARNTISGQLHPSRFVPIPSLNPYDAGVRREVLEPEDQEAFAEVLEKYLAGIALDGKDSMYKEETIGSDTERTVTIFGWPVDEERGKENQRIRALQMCQVLTPDKKWITEIIEFIAAW